MNTPDISVIIPAHNEVQYIGKCLRAVKRAATRLPDKTVETIVVTNRCTDKTAWLAQYHGARVIDCDARCISAVRNAGIRAASGEIIVTIDADSLMSPESLLEITELLGSGKYIGGGTPIEFERMSLGILLSGLYIGLNLLPTMLKSGGALSGAMFWFRKDDWAQIGGFDEHLVSLEDMDFASRLKALGDTQGKRYGTLLRSYLITSSRKFDQFGDWYLLQNRELTKRIFTGTDEEAANEFYYDVR